MKSDTFVIKTKVSLFSCVRTVTNKMGTLVAFSKKGALF